MNQVKELMRKHNLPVSAGDFMSPHDTQVLTDFAHFKGITGMQALYGLSHNYDATVARLFGVSDVVAAANAAKQAADKARMDAEKAEAAKAAEEKAALEAQQLAAAATEPEATPEVEPEAAIQEDAVTSEE